MSDDYTERAPRPDLYAHVACMWSAVTRGPDVAGARVLPDGCVDIIRAPGCEPWVAGPDTASRRSLVAPGTVLSAIRFLPAMAAPILRAPVSMLTDRSVALAELWPGDSIRRLRAALDNSDSIHDALSILESAVADRISDALEPDPLVRAMIRRILHSVSVSTISIDSKVERTPIGIRQMRRRFIASVGYGPKTFERIARFRRFLVLANSAAASGLAAMATEAGYADQSHLSRECLRLARSSPRVLARDPQQMSDLFKTLRVPAATVAA
jgi:hypothetical protein